MIEQTYNDLMNKLALVPIRYSTARQDLSEAVRDTKNAEREADDIKAGLVITNGGYAGLGSNEKARELSLGRLLVSDQSYRSAANLQYRAEQRQAQAQIAMDNIKMDFDTLRIMASLHGDYMKYSALVASNPSMADQLGL